MRIRLSTDVHYEYTAGDLSSLSKYLQNHNVREPV